MSERYEIVGGERDGLQLEATDGHDLLRQLTNLKLPGGVFTLDGTTEAGRRRLRLNSPKPKEQPHD